MKIRQKLIIAFSILIIIVLAEVVLNQVVANRAKETYQALHDKINPAIIVLTKFESVNKELYLLTTNRIKGDSKTQTVNRFKAIIEVELPYIKKELLQLKEYPPKIITDKSILEKLIKDTDYLIYLSTKVNNLLINQRNDEVNIKLVKNIWSNEMEELYLILDRGIKEIGLNFNRSFKTYNMELSDSLEAVSKIILIVGVIGVLLGIVITMNITYTISKPISQLKKAALMISKGRLDEQIVIKGKNELAELGNLFNDMSSSLIKSFNKQENQINQIKSVNKELEEFVYVASHDLQEPLRTISSYIGLIGELYQDQLDDDALKYMKFVEEASERMKTLISDLLDYSRLGKEKVITKVNCNTIVKNITLDFGLYINENNALIKYDKLPTIIGFELELKQLFQNLINNGLKFRKNDVFPQIEIKAIDKPDHWLFSVRDNGIGMDAKYFERVFVIFQKLHNISEYKGTGIGLSVCKKIVEIHDGKIWVESELGKGTTFYFTITKKLIKTIKNEKI